MGPAYRAQVLETHAAILLFLGDRAYKLKKAVDLGFLDFRDRTDRNAVCHREVELNRRLAADVYLGVADVHGPGGELWDHLVVMRRMPPERRLSTLIRAGAPVEDDLRRLARLLARFHATADRSPVIAAEGTRAALRGRWDATFAQLRPFHDGVLDAGAAIEVEHLTHEFLAGREPLFGERVEHGRIVDGHGDLIADDVFCLDDGPRPLDCLEFDDRLRYLDALDDAAFLAMDIEHLGANDLARLFLDWYAEFSGDPAPAALRDHYIAYRAFVRAKVACLRHEQGDLSATADVATYTDLTLRHLRAGTVRLVLVGGGPGTGKTTLAGALADRLGAVVLSSDRIRKELAGLAPEMSASAAYRHGIYTTEWTDRTYRELLHRAERLLGRGETVILDASWTAERHREAARALGAATHSRVREIRCTADRATVNERLARRAGGMSDADAAIASAMAAAVAPWPQATDVATDQPVDDILDRALADVTLGRPLQVLRP
ncbi:AAA family ATPase [Actinoplanes sp. TBRC 11911]|uniref:bifunctional aminoglycoside phosphotransferase/ATP-binding protein n=1 Tax=Actinoplanes sp. TBRC 11911 TaxID=2729386 RepID=UPI00145D9495|nr:AAA family ATPase [Actinoplanes sp. TBRC 11911]NMO57276.1 AAA family ATPase [Actinoplanes sp. TBRC 11911]